MINAICPYCNSVKCITFDEKLMRELAELGHAETQCDNCDEYFDIQYTPIALQPRVRKTEALNESYSSS